MLYGSLCSLNRNKSETFSPPQETIFVADGGQDYRTECAKSGEPLLETTRIPGEPYPEALELALVHMLQGRPYGRSAYEVRGAVLLGISKRPWLTQVVAVGAAQGKTRAPTITS
jgi:hypothetical protein